MSNCNWFVYALKAIINYIFGQSLIRIIKSSLRTNKLNFIQIYWICQTSSKSSKSSANLNILFWPMGKY